MLPTTAPMSARNQVSTPRPPGGVDQTPIASTTREFAIEKFRRFRQLQEAEALSPLRFIDDYNRGKFDVLKVYYPKALRELLYATARRLSEEQDRSASDEEEDPFNRTTSAASKEVNVSTLSSKRSMPLLQGYASRSPAISRRSSPTHSLAPSISMSELSNARGRLRRAIDLPPLSPPPSRPLPSPPASSQCSSAGSPIKGSQKDLQGAKSQSSSTAALIRAPSASTPTPRTHRALTAPTSAAPNLERSSTTRSSRSNEQALPDDGWLHPCERDIIIDDVTYLERRDTGRRRGEEDGWKSMASKAASLVKAKAKGRPDTANTVSSTTTQRWERGPDY